jgi:hypothetical protein
MKLRSLTKRFLLVELFLAAFGVASLLLAPLAESYRTRAFRKAYAKLSHLPSEVADWRLADVIPPDLTRATGSVQGNLNIVMGAYKQEETGEEVLLRVAHWYHPIRCYVLNGWEMVPGPMKVLAAEEAKNLRMAGVREAHLRQGGDEVTILFWESSLTAPEMTRPVPLTADMSLKQRLLRQVVTLRRRVQRFLRRGPIIVQVVSHKVDFSASERDALLRLVSGLLRGLPELLK